MTKSKKLRLGSRDLVFKNFAFISLLLLGFVYSCDTGMEDLTELEEENEEVELNAPIIQTPKPLIHLEDNLDEQDQLGWCLDTRGNGFNELLHVHSCKPNGGDVQFFYNEASLQICSAEYDGFCIEMLGGPSEGMSLSLVESDVDSDDQKFVYLEESGEFRSMTDSELCLAAGSESSAAGIYMSRSLTLEVSSETETALKKWVIAGI